MTTSERLTAEGFVTVTEAAKFLAIPRTSMYELISANLITHTKIRRRLCVSKAALRAYASSRLVIGSVA